MLVEDIPILCVALTTRVYAPWICVSDKSPVRGPVPPALRSLKVSSTAVYFISPISPGLHSSLGFAKAAASLHSCVDCAIAGTEAQRLF